MEMTMVTKRKLIYPPASTNMGRTIMCILISEDQMGRESQSKKKETRAI